MQESSSDTVKVFYLDGERAIGVLRELAEAALREEPNNEEILLFGSLSPGDYAPGSDADLLILLREDARPSIDRIPQFMRAFSGAGLPVEVFPYTRGEMERMEQSKNLFIERILREGIIIARR